MSADLSLLVMTDLNVEACRKGGHPSPFGRSATPGRVVVRHIDRTVDHQLAHADAADLRLPRGDRDVAAQAHIAKAAEVRVPTGRLLEPAQFDAYGPDSSDERERLAHGVPLIRIHDEQEVLARVPLGANEPRGIFGRRLAADLELHSHHAVLALEEVDLTFDLLALRLR